MNLVKTSYRSDDVTILLKDISGIITPLSTEEREKLNQTGVHYSEMLPLEYKPTEKYMEIYNEALQTLSYKTANATAILAKKLYEKYGNKLVLVSLARAGTPIGILLKRFIRFKYNIVVPHYSISIIRGKGIDVNAINYIVDRHGSYGLQFVDGWIGKGAINGVLVEACELLKTESFKFSSLDSTLAVLSDPAFITDLCGTHEDFLIPSACLNSTVSGLISRTFLRNDIIGPNDFHGAVYYGELELEDKSNEFIDTVSNYFEKINYDYFQDNSSIMQDSKTGIDEVRNIARDFGILDISKIKPGVGETTRVLLRRVPYCVLLRNLADMQKFPHIKRLCEEKNIPIKEYPLQMYNVCGIIKTLSDI
ncbi:MAG: cysteine protease StiP family protein [Clostridia bacterium]|nr:cysteine protease StiP family protein [Clostridia bacterium]